MTNPLILVVTLALSSPIVESEMLQGFIDSKKPNNVGAGEVIFTTPVDLNEDAMCCPSARGILVFGIVAGKLSSIEGHWYKDPSLDP